MSVKLWEAPGGVGCLTTLSELKPPGGSAKEDPHACGGRGGGWGGVGGAGSSRMWDHVGVELS